MSVSAPETMPKFLSEVAPIASTYLADEGVFQKGDLGMWQRRKIDGVAQRSFRRHPFKVGGSFGRNAIDDVTAVMHSKFGIADIRLRVIDTPERYRVDTEFTEHTPRESARESGWQVNRVTAQVSIDSSELRNLLRELHEK